MTAYLATHTQSVKTVLDFFSTKHRTKTVKYIFPLIIECRFDSAFPLNLWQGIYHTHTMHQCHIRETEEAETAPQESKSSQQKVVNLPNAGFL